MNKKPIPKTTDVITPVAVKPAPAATKIAKPAAAAPVKTARMGRPPSIKTTVVKKAPVSPAAKTSPAKISKAAAPAPVKPPVVAKEKIKKDKLVRDSFTMPETEYAVLGKTKKAALKAGFTIKKSELLRIGVTLVGQLEIAQLQTALESLMPVKAGRPKKDK